MTESFFSSFVVGEIFISFLDEDVKKKLPSGHFFLLEIGGCLGLEQKEKRSSLPGHQPLRVANSS